MIFFGLKSGQDLENRAAHPHQEFPGVPPPPGTKGIIIKGCAALSGSLWVENLVIYASKKFWL